MRAGTRAHTDTCACGGELRSQEWCFRFGGLKQRPHHARRRPRRLLSLPALRFEPARVLFRCSRLPCFPRMDGSKEFEDVAIPRAPLVRYSRSRSSSSPKSAREDIGACRIDRRTCARFLSYSRFISLKLLLRVLPSSPVDLFERASARRCNLAAFSRSALR